MNLNSLMPTLGNNSLNELLRLLREGRWHVDHGSLLRFPMCLQPEREGFAGGSISGIEKLGRWSLFDVGFRDRDKKYCQMNGVGNSAEMYYEMGALVRSSQIDEASPEANAWLMEWAQLLGVQRQDLRLNSWAVRGPNGIHWHFDAEDVIHFQIKGEKLFKFLRTRETLMADSTFKRSERHFKSQIIARSNVESNVQSNAESNAQSGFENAESQIVGPGTITVIPRGVWHWSESQSEESFAVSLCVNPASVGSALAQAVNRRLRMSLENRQPLMGSIESQTAALAACIGDLQGMLDSLQARSVLADENRLRIEAGDLDHAAIIPHPLAQILDPFAHVAQRFGDEPAASSSVRVKMGEQIYEFKGTAVHQKIVTLIFEDPRGVEFEKLSKRAAEHSVTESELRELALSLTRAGLISVLPQSAKSP